MMLAMSLGALGSRSETRSLSSCAVTLEVQWRRTYLSQWADDFNDCDEGDESNTRRPLRRAERNTLAQKLKL